MHRSIQSLVVVMLFSSCALAQDPIRSHPRLRPAPQASNRPAAEGPARYVSPTGNDSNDGSINSPWRTVQHAVNQIRAGETLYLRGGTYRENVNVSRVGKKDAPITIRAYTGELAILDGSMAEFFDKPDEAWEPVPDGGKGEFRSKRTYPGIRDLVGAFGDSMVGLQTYWHYQDLRSENELWDEEKDKDVVPTWVGPGMLYDQDTGYIHVRLAHTNIQGDIDNYKGETDPRKLPLVIAPYRSIPLHVDRASHIRFQDLVIRGGGYDVVVTDQSDNLEFDNVIIHAGTYGMNNRNTVGLKFHHSAIYGNIPPWCFRTENGLRNRPGRGRRDVARLTGHALWVAETGLEYSIYAIPTNNDFEISYSTFTDCHDALYLGGINTKFHHNLVDNMQDDGIYISPCYAYTEKSEVHIYQNVFMRQLTPWALGGPITNVKNTTIFAYRNLVDLRGACKYQRPNSKNPVFEGYRTINVMISHGPAPWPAMNLYHNTFLIAGNPRTSHVGLMGGGKESEATRRLMNNIFLMTDKLPAYSAPTQPTFVEAGNLYWGSNMTPELAETYFEKFRSSEQFKASEQASKIGASTKSIVANPMLDLGIEDIRPQKGSPAIDAGIDIPKEWPDPYREADAGAPDIGAVPAGATIFEAGYAQPATQRKQ